MKYLYVLTSNDSDYYLEQALLSMHSLRLHMPNAFISLIVDNITEATLTGKREAIRGLVNELKSVTIEDRFNKKARSRWLKTSTREHITGDFLFIDCDTIIAEDITALSNMKINLGAVLNEHASLSDLAKYNPAYLKEMQKLDRKLGFSSTINLNHYFNSGLLLCKDSTIAHDFFGEWHRLWLYCFEQGNVTDQQSFNQSNYIQGNVISELGGEWNCQVLSDGGIRYLHKANIIHYFNPIIEENPYLLGSQKVFEKVKKTGVIDQEIMDMLSNPKGLFVLNSRLKVVDIPMRKFSKSITYAVAQRLFNTKFGTIIESMTWFMYQKMFKPLRVKLSKK